MNASLNVQGISVSIIQQQESEYISLTDIARYKDKDEPKDVVKNRMRTKSTIEFLWLREFLNNPNFKGVEFDPFKNQAGSNAFVLSPQKWIESTHAIGMINKSWRYGWWTYAHKDIAMEFASWISVEFKLYLIKEFQRLKQQEVKSLDWNIKRLISKVNYRIHTDAIKDSLMPKELSQQEINFIYADEADVLNKALFGITAKEWRSIHPWKKGNMRDYATIHQLIVLANIESINAEFIITDMPQPQRLTRLNAIAIYQMKSLLGQNIIDRLPKQ